MMKSKSPHRVRVGTNGWRIKFAAVAAAALLGLAFPAQAAYPDRPIELVVAWPAGGGIDVPGRLIAQTLSKLWGVPINVVNKPGASGVKGTLEALSSRPDGYTMIVESGATSSIQVNAVKDVPYKIEDRTYVSRVVALPMNYIVAANSPFKTIKDVADAAKADPGNFVWATAAPSTVLALSLSQFFQAIGVPTAKTRRVAFVGGPEVAQAVAGGHAKFGAFAVNSTLPLVQAGKLRSIGVLTPERVPSLPNVPTSAEQGFPQLDASAWIGVSGPRGLPAEVVAKWDEALRAAVKDKEFTAAADRIGTVPFYLGPAEFRAFVLNETKQVAGLLAQ